MKHIVKRYLFQEKVTQEILNKGEKVNIQDKNLVDRTRNKARGLFIETDKGYIIKAFAYKHKGETALISIPDLSLVYFDSAYNLNVLRKEKETELFSKRILKEEKLGEDAINEVYRYYGYASSCIISLFTAMESFINHIMPNDKPYLKL